MSPQYSIAVFRVGQLAKIIGFDRDYATQPLYFLNPATPAANTVVTAVEGDAQLWLGGLESADFVALDGDVPLVAVEGSGRVRLRSREGLVAEAAIEEAVAVGTLLRLDG